MSGGDFLIRAATLKDLERLMEIEEECFSSPWPRSAMKEEILGDTWSRLMVAQEDDAIVGFMVYWRVHNERHLLNLATDTGHRTRGVASALMEHLIDDAAQEDDGLVVLEVRESNAPAIGLYQSYGFQVIGKRAGYYADNGEDALVMLRTVEEKTETTEE